MVESINDLWQETLKHIESKVSKPSFETWLSQTEALSYDDDTLIICAPNVFVRDWLEDRYQTFLQDAVENMTGMQFNIKFVLP